MQFRIDPAIIERFPGALVGIMVARDLDNTGTASDIAPLLKAAADQLITRIGDTPLIEHPHIAPWRDAYRAFGAKASKYPSSIENLARRIKKDELPGHINKLVDVYNTISLRHFIPVGGEDIAALEGDIALRFAGEDEPAVEMLGEGVARPPKSGEVIYADAVGAICRRWNWKEAERTKLTEATTKAVLFIETLPPVNHDMVQTAMDELMEMVTQFCGGTINGVICDGDSPEFDLGN
jgi:DNA/RNA-binding domain of Phe-tRNA-synthetase-like protein